MKSNILFILLFFVLNSFTFAQDKCIKDLKKQIKEYAGQNHSKVALLSTPGKSTGYNFHLSPEDLENNKKTSKNIKTWWVKAPFRFYLMSSKKFNNNAILKIYEGHTVDPDKLLYKLKDEANDDKPSYIDVDLNKSSNLKFLFKIQFSNEKEGCAAFYSAVFKNHNYSFQKED